MAIILVVINVYFKLNYHMLLMAIGGVILLMVIGGYFICGYCDYFRLNYHRLLVVISGLFINGYLWLCLIF
jgi:hypothetical protein